MVTLVTGATGFIGGRLTAALLARGDRVRILVRDEGRAQTLRERGADLAVGDVRDAQALRRAVAGVEVVYHCAAAVGDWLDPEEARRINVEGTRNLIAACAGAGVRRVLHLSSLSVLGTRHHHGTDESAPYRYGDPYTDTKIDSERVVLDSARRGALEPVCLRAGFVYGPGDRQLFPRLLRALAGGRFMYVGAGTKEMNCLYVEDLVQAALVAERKPEAAGQAYNLTDGTRTTIREFVSFIADYLGLPAPTRSVPAPVAVAGCAVAELLARLRRAKEAPRLNRSALRFLYYNQHFSIEKARAELGYAPRFSYREGLPPTLDWFRANGLLPEAAAAAPARGGDGAG